MFDILTFQSRSTFWVLGSLMLRKGCRGTSASSQWAGGTRAIRTLPFFESLPRFGSHCVTHVPSKASDPSSSRDTNFLANLLLYKPNYGTCSLARKIDINPVKHGDCSIVTEVEGVFLFFSLGRRALVPKTLNICWLVTPNTTKSYHITDICLAFDHRSRASELGQRLIQPWNERGR